MTTTPGDSEQITKAETLSSAALWFGIFGGPLVWAAQLLLDFGLDEAVVCAPGSLTKGQFFNTGIGTVIQIVNAIATAVTVLAFVVAYRSYRRHRHRDSNAGQRARWMSVAGMFNSTLFLIIVVMKFVSPLTLTPCMRPL